MNMPTETAKYLINVQDGINNLERATIAMVLATTASKDSDAALFVTSDATNMFVKGAVNGLAADGHEPIADLMSQFMGNGGKVWVCPICVKTKGIQADELVDGVEIAGAPKTMAYLQSGAMLLA